MRALTRHPLRFRGVRHRPALLEHTGDQEPPAEDPSDEPYIGTWENLLLELWTFASHTPVGVLLFRQPVSVTHLMAEYT